MDQPTHPPARRAQVSVVKAHPNMFGPEELLTVGTEGDIGACVYTFIRFYFLYICMPLSFVEVESSGRERERDR